MSDQKELNPQSLLEEMDIDVYASKTTGEISIFYGKPLRKLLEHVEFHEDTHDLYFVYEDEIQQFGLPMKETMTESFMKSEFIGVFEMDLEDQTVVAKALKPLIVKPIKPKNEENH